MSVESKSKNPWIQILRAISVLIVIAYHFDLPVSNGFIGVDIFFVISGYVITQSLMRSSEDSWFSRLKQFYIKRVARLFPAFLAVFIFTIIASILFLSPNVGVQQNAIKSSFGATLGISNFVIPRVTGDYFGALGNTNPFQHTWSLSVEEQFYFVFPIVFLLFIHKKLRNGNFIFPVLFLAGLAILSFSLVLPIDTLDKFSNLGTTEYFAPQNRAWEFLAGVIAALLSASNLRVRTKYKTRILSALCGLLLFISASNIFAFQTNFYQVIIPVMLASLFLFVSDMSTADSRSVIKHSRFRESFVTMGDWSYSLYLWHWPIWVFTKLFFPENKVVSLLIASLLTFSLAALTYKIIETRYNFTKKDHVIYWFKFFSIGQALAVSLFFLGYQGGSKGWGKDWALNSHAIMQRGCDSGLIDLEKCSWGNSNAEEKMFIVGDSMSWAIGDAFIDSALASNMQAISLTRNGCSITKSGIDKSGECGVWRESVIGILLREKPSLIVIANSIGYPEEDLQGMGNLVNLLRESSIRVIFVTPPPGGDVYSGLRALAFRPGENSRESAIPAKIELSKYGLSGNPFDSGLIIYDPAEDLCNSKCIIAKDGKDYYNYGGHLSLYGNRVLQDSINQKVKRIQQK
jgi:peptidoglycan/LPS O-acetylase OafA/YrhL